jgi:predicted permease
MQLDGPAFTSVFQGSIRFNNYVGVTAAAGLFGTEGIALAAICNAAIVPTVNTLCVLVFARHGTAKLSGRGIARQLMTNPLVLASLSGILVQALGLGLPPGIEPALRTLGAASLPLGLLCIGAALEFHAARRWVGPVLSSSATKFLVMPLVTLAVALLVRLEGQALTTALLFQTLPTASSAYIMSRQLGGDAPLMAGITGRADGPCHGGDPAGPDRVHRLDRDLIGQASHSGDQPRNWLVISLNGSALPRYRRRRP